MLDAQIERERDRVLQPVGGEARGVQGGEPARVEPFLDAGFSSRNPRPGIPR